VKDRKKGNLAGVGQQTLPTPGSENKTQDTEKNGGKNPYIGDIPEIGQNLP
jgi:hypothetical protein